MARRKKESETGIRKTTGSQSKSRRTLRNEAKKYVTYTPEEKPTYKSFIRTVLVSILFLIGLIVWHDSHIRPSGEIGAGGLKVHYIDVGQGDCIYIECEGQNMLIDCGEASKADEVCSYLNAQGVEALDYVIGTHFHADHMGGMSEIVKSYNIEDLIIPPINEDKVPTEKYFERFLDAAENENLKLEEAVVGRKYKLGSAVWEIIAPVSKKSSNTNNTSVGIILVYGKKSFVFTGDAEASAEKEIIEAGRLKHIDVYKADHHGSNTSSSDEFLSVITPEIAVISCGAGNSYGHPGDEAVERIKKYTNEIYRTDLDGTIVIESDGKELTINAERERK